MLINLSNHPHTQWSEAQLQAALQRWGEVESKPFPEVHPQIGPEMLEWQALQIVREIENAIRAPCYARENTP